MRSSQQYALSVSRIDAYCVVRAAGELDLAAVSHMRDAVQAARRRADHIVVDLRAVSFLDGFALEALITLQREATDRSSLHVVPGAGIQQVLDLTGARAALHWISPEQLGG